MSGEQAHAQDREARDRDFQQTKHPGSAQEGEGSAWEYTRTRAGRLVTKYITYNYIFKKNKTILNYV